MAERRAKKNELAEKERSIKRKHLAEKEEQRRELRKEEKDEQEEHNKETMSKLVDRLKLDLPADEIPVAIKKTLEEKQEQELNDMLVSLFEQKAKELKEEVLALLEEKIRKEQAIKDDYKDRAEMWGGSPEELKKEMEKELNDLDWTYQNKQAELEEEVQARLLEKENSDMIELREGQLKEKKEVFEEHLPESLLKDFIREANEEEEQELAALKVEMEKEKQRRLQELELARKVV